MKCGGNATATDFFKRNGGLDRYNDSKSKYSSRVGQMYREHLKKLAEEDARRYPDRIVIEGVLDENVSAFTSKEDFFADWENPGTVRQQSFKTETYVIENAGTASNPELKLSPLSEDAPSFPEPELAPQPVQVVAEPVVIKPSISAPVFNAGSNILRPTTKKGLGAKKAVKIDFDEAERRAKEQEILRKQAEEEERKRLEEEEKRKAENPMGYVAEKIQNQAYRPQVPAPYVPVADIPQVKISDDVADRLGLGLGRIQLAATTAAVEKATKVAQLNAACEGSTDAQKRFTNAKAISSDEYFGRGKFNESEK
jgi:ADP-ribosylation factor GTPase-activating protein 2/3